MHTAKQSSTACGLYQHCRAVFARSAALVVSRGRPCRRHTGGCVGPALAAHAAAGGAVAAHGSIGCRVTRAGALHTKSRMSIMLFTMHKERISVCPLIMPAVVATKYAKRISLRTCGHV
jgi:hypothetical protein